MNSTIDALTFDCADPEPLARFWAAALGFEFVEIDEGDAWIRDPSGKLPNLLFQIVPEGKTAKNRLHLDLVPPCTMQEEVERLAGLGATTQRKVEENQSYWTIMLDPEGNEFCVLQGESERRPPGEG